VEHQAPSPGPRLARGVELRRTRTGTLLAAPSRRAYCQVEPALDGLIVQLERGGVTAGEVAQRFGDAAADLVDELRAGGFLVDSPSAGPVRRVVVTRDGLEVDGADRLVAATYRLLQPLFNPVGATLLVALAVVGLASPFTGVLTESHVDVSPVLAAVLIICLDLLLAVVHELGHALVLARHGRKVGRVGIGLYWGAPTFYVESTAALFLPKSARLQQAAAGPLVEAALAGVLGGLALLLPPGPGRVILGQAAGLACLGVALNLTPLLKLDGYWLLSDALDMPDLQEQARAAVRRVATGSRTRSDLIGASYGVVSLVFGLLLLAYSCYLWVTIIGDVVVGAWAESLLGKALALALALPAAGLVLHLLWSLVAPRRAG